MERPRDVASRVVVPWGTHARHELHATGTAKMDEEASAGVGTGNNEGRREHGVGNEVPPPVVAATKPQTLQRKPQDKSFPGVLGSRTITLRSPRLRIA